MASTQGGAAPLSNSQAAASSSQAQLTSLPDPGIGWAFGLIGGEGSKAASSWLSSLGGDLASGLEAGFVGFFKDMWKVVAGPVYIALGLFILLFTLAHYYQNDIMGLVRMVMGGM